MTVKKFFAACFSACFMAVVIGIISLMLLKSSNLWKLDLGIVLMPKLMLVLCIILHALAAMALLVLLKFKKEHTIGVILTNVAFFGFVLQAPQVMEGAEIIVDYGGRPLIYPVSHNAHIWGAYEIYSDTPDRYRKRIPSVIPGCVEVENIPSGLSQGEILYPYRDYDTIGTARITFVYEEETLRRLGCHAEYLRVFIYDAAVLEMTAGLVNEKINVIWDIRHDHLDTSLCGSWINSVQSRADIDPDTLTCPIKSAKMTYYPRS